MIGILKLQNEQILKMELEYRIVKLEDKEKLQKLGLNSYGQFKEVLTKENWENMIHF